MKTARSLFSIVLALSLLLSLCLPAFAEEETQYFDGLSMEFDNPTDNSGWSTFAVDYDIWLDPIYISKTPTIKDGHLSFATNYIDTTLYSPDDFDYTVKPSDTFSISFIPSVYSNWMTGSCSLSIRVDGKSYYFYLDDIWSMERYHNSTTVPMGLSGKLESFSLSFDNLYYAQVAGIQIDYIRIGTLSDTPPSIPAEESVKLRHSLNLASDISMNYMIPEADLAGYDAHTAYLEIAIPIYDTANGSYDGSTLQTLSPQYRDGYYYFTLEGMTALQMNDTLTATLHASRDGVSYSFPVDRYSIVTYALSQLNNPGTSAELKTLCAELLRYGGKAQAYKGYRTSDLADSKLTAKHKTYLSDLNAVSFTDHYEEISNESTLFRWTGKSLNLSTRVGLIFYTEKTDATLADTDWYAEIRYKDMDGRELMQKISPADMSLSDSVYNFEFSGLTAAELRSPVSVTIRSATTGEALSNTLIYSADTYGLDKTDSLGDVCKALMAYSDSAYAYFTR